MDRPKDSVLFFAQQIVADTVSDADRALAVLSFLESTLKPSDRKRYFDRVMNRVDPVGLEATLDLVAGLFARWTDWPIDGQVEPLIITAAASTPTGAPLTVVNEDLGLRFTAHQPKDVVLTFVSAAVATGVGLGQQAWAIAFFLDSALEPGDALLLAQRMRRADDDLDLGEVDEIVRALIQRWAPTGNRATRRAEQRHEGHGEAGAQRGAHGQQRARRQPVRREQRSRRA
ncbi:hypothetical protein BC739_006720 [Kutzneria viridogrisea]|uniref:Uncharacterized protein n=1 Tax=Kutzneria viridogrisea TaxID=47990 RepID=A0ABR6BRG0_9PSEU|nr:hypothetical protein [Kutzneria viridogrisea]